VKIVDWYEREIHVGDQVVTDISDDREEFPPGTVVRITDWDGDVDDEGCTIAITPKVIVKWPGFDGEETFSSYWSGAEGDFFGNVDDLTVVQSAEVWEI
jgi:hypothetical protein